MMYELIVDCTNKCVSKCINCGTDSAACGECHIDLSILKSILDFSKQISSQVYLGGGCFFCHPQWKDLLEFNKKFAADIIVDVPLDKLVLDSIASYPPKTYNYQVSVSLWGIEEGHNKLAGTDSFSLFADYKKLLSHNMRVSFVITEELICSAKEIISFINENSQIKSFYFHRLMPTGRCSSGSLPKEEIIKSFQNQLLSSVDEPDKLRFHHTLLDANCNAFHKRLYIDYHGDIYGCGWVSANTAPIANINGEILLSALVVRAQNGEFDGMTICPLTDN